MLDNYKVKNGHGDVVKLVSNGTVTQNYDFDAYGNQKGESNAADTNPFRYCGEYFDQESGLIYLRARYYDPSAGRFINEDPAKDGLNWYTYCGNNPLNFIDPDGMRYIPLRKTVEEAGGSIEWDSSTNTATVTLNGIKVEYSDGDSVGSFIQNDTMYVDDAQFNSDFYDLSGAVIQHGDIIVAGVYGRATGVDMTLGGYDGRKVPTSLQFFNVEAGIIKILKNGRVITVDLACVTASAHASISLSGIDLEAKLSLVSVGAEATVPIPGTNSNLELRVEGNIGFGATFKVGDGFKIGGSALVGSTISIKITKRN